MIKAHCLYKIGEPFEHYLYVLQTKNYTDSMDILAIRSDFTDAIMPLYSSCIKFKEDLGYPTTEMLININHSFYTNIKTAIICCGLTLRGSHLCERVGKFLKENVSALCYNNITNSQNGHPLSTNVKTQHSLFTSMNRTLARREVLAYVQDKIPT